MSDYIEEQLKRIQRKVRLKEQLADGGAVLEKLTALFKADDPSTGYGVVVGMAAALLIAEKFDNLTDAKRELRLMVDAARTAYADSLDERRDEPQKP